MLGLSEHDTRVVTKKTPLVYKIQVSFRKLLNSCILFNIADKINTKLNDFEELVVLFLSRYGAYVDNPIHVLTAFDEGECMPNFEAS